MSKLSDLTSSFQESATQQVESSKKIVQTALADHENFIRSTLKQNEKKIVNDIRAQNRQSRRLLLNSWRLAGLTFLLIALAAAGVLKYQGEMIGDRWKIISSQHQTIEHLEETTWGITLRENDQGRFIILPEDQMINTTWSIGKQKAIRLIDPE